MMVVVVVIGYLPPVIITSLEPLTKFMRKPTEKVLNRISFSFSKGYWGGDTDYDARTLILPQVGS